MTNVRTIPPELPSRVKAKAIAFCTNLKRHDNAHQAHEATTACVEPSFLVTAMRKTGYFRTWSHSTTAQEITNFQMPRNSRHSALDIPCWFSADPFWMEGVVVCSCWWGAQLSTLHKKTILQIKSKSKAIYCVSYHLIVLNFSDLPTTQLMSSPAAKPGKTKTCCPVSRPKVGINEALDVSRARTITCPRDTNTCTTQWDGVHLFFKLACFFDEKKKQRGDQPWLPESACPPFFSSYPATMSPASKLSWIQSGVVPARNPLISKQKRHLHLHTLWISLDYIVSICLLSS